MNGKTAFGVLLIAAGALAVLRILGVTIGPLFGFLFPIILLGLGYVGLKNGKTVIGGIMLAIGVIMLLAKLSGIIFFLLAIGAILWGVSMFKSNKKVY